MKEWYLSKTLWLNVIGLLVLLAQYLGTINIIAPATIASILAVLNLILRVFFTSQPLAVNAENK